MLKKYFYSFSFLYKENYKDFFNAFIKMKILALKAY